MRTGAELLTLTGHTGLGLRGGLRSRRAARGDRELRRDRPALGRRHGRAGPRALWARRRQQRRGVQPGRSARRKRGRRRDAGVGHHPLGEPGAGHLRESWRDAKRRLQPGRIASGDDELQRPSAPLGSLVGARAPDVLRPGGEHGLGLRAGWIDPGHRGDRITRGVGHRVGQGPPRPGHSWNHQRGRRQPGRWPHRHRELRSDEPAASRYGTRHRESGSEP